jgi:EAL domain-containing protein (putative c-di-GMP-specific phosphodiesterase class I)
MSRSQAVLPRPRDAAVRGGPVPLTELREALVSSRIRALYQPIVRIADGVPVAVEVLARLAHPARGVVQPDLFVPQIERAGLALKLTEAVGLSAFADWRDGRLERLDLSLALNFPLDVLLLPAALRWLERARQSAGIPAQRITIELTESRPIGKVTALAASVARLRRQGYALAIDDVGPTLRDHRALLDMGFTTLKLDKGLVGAAPQHPAAAGFLVRTVEEAHAAGLQVVAEGVASPALWARMAAFAVDQAQGFCVARPMAAASVAEWQCDWRVAAQILGVQGPLTG